MFVKKKSYGNKLVDYKNKVYENGTKKGCVIFGFPILEGYRMTSCECSNNIIYENIYKDNYSKSSKDNKLKYTQSSKRIQNKNGYIDREYSNSYKKYLYRRAIGYENRSTNEKKYNHRAVLKKEALTEKKELWNSCTNTYDLKDCSKSNAILYNPSNKTFSTQGAVSNNEKINRLKYDTILRSQYNIGNDNSNVNNLVNGLYPISLYKNTHPKNKKNEQELCELKKCYNKKSCIRFC